MAHIIQDSPELYLNHTGAGQGACAARSDTSADYGSDAATTAAAATTAEAAAAAAATTAAAAAAAKAAVCQMCLRQGGQPDALKAKRASETGGTR